MHASLAQLRPLNILHVDDDFARASRQHERNYVVD